jgi:DNA-binding GntR family transcriptional regulator
VAHATSADRGVGVAPHSLREVSEAGFRNVTRLEVKGRGQVYGYHLIEAAMANDPMAVCLKLGVVQGAEWLHLRCLHLADGGPLLY